MLCCVVAPGLPRVLHPSMWLRCGGVTKTSSCCWPMEGTPMLPTRSERGSLAACEILTLGPVSYFLLCIRKMFCHFCGRVISVGGTNLTSALMNQLAQILICCLHLLYFPPGAGWEHSGAVCRATGQPQVCPTPPEPPDTVRRRRRGPDLFPIL